MLKLTIIHVGSVKERYLTDAIAEYEKRLSGYCVVNYVLIKDERLPDKPSHSEIAQALEREADRILAALPPRAYKIALCVEGKLVSSEELASRISALPNQGCSEIALIIGGSDGLSPRVKSSSDFRLSISPMTFPHQLMRVILLEQLYRAFTIINGAHYHK